MDYKGPKILEVEGFPAKTNLEESISVESVDLSSCEVNITILQKYFFYYLNLKRKIIKNEHHK